MKKLILFTLMLVSMTLVHAQNTCNFYRTDNGTGRTTIGPPPSWHVSTLYEHQTGEYDNDEFCFNLVVHKVQRSDGTGGPSETQISDKVYQMISVFSSFNIHFYWDGTFLDINDTDLYNDIEIPYAVSTAPYFVPGAINIFYWDHWGGASSNLESTVIRMFGATLNASDTSTLIHEMGHQLGLFHTFHGRTLDPTEHPGEDDELPGAASSPNSHFTGDFVFDTEADGNNYDGLCGIVHDDITDPTALSPNMDNYMSYGGEHCRDFFTPGQITRMRYIISEEVMPHLNDALTLCEPYPPACADCDGPYYDLAMNRVEEYLSFNETCTEATFGFPMIGPATCNYKLRVTSSIATMDIPLTGIHTIALDPLSPFVTVDVLFDEDQDGIYEALNCEEVFECVPDICDDCEDMALSIKDSFTASQPSSGCTYVCFDIPTDFNDCYTGTINWGDGTTTTISSGIATSLCHEYSASFDPNETITITIVDENDQTCSTSYVDVCIACDVSCLDVAEAIKEEFTETITGGCTQICTELPAGLSECFSGVIDWGDGTTSTFPTFGSGTICHQYTSHSGPTWLSVTVYLNGESCEVFDYTQIFGCSGMGKTQITLSPNPSKSKQTISFDGIEHTKVQEITILDLFGNQKSSIIPVDNSFEINTLQKGMYLIRFQTTEGTITKKLLVE